jgi:hypothetical protein
MRCPMPVRHVSRTQIRPHSTPEQPSRAPPRPDISFPSRLQDFFPRINRLPPVRPRLPRSPRSPVAKSSRKPSTRSHQIGVERGRRRWRARDEAQREDPQGHELRDRGGPRCLGTIPLSPLPAPPARPRSRAIRRDRRAIRSMRGRPRAVRASSVAPCPCGGGAISEI